MSSEVQNEKNLKGVEVPDAIPSQATFSLDDFIQQKCTVPVTACTVYLDADGGKQLDEALRHQESISAQLSKLDGASASGLSISEANPVLEARLEAEAELASTNNLIEQLKNRIIGSALYVEFQVRQASAITKSQKMARASLPDDTEDMSELEIQSVFVDYAMAAAVIRVTNSDQQVIEAPFTLEQIRGLRGALIQTEDTKLVHTLNEAVSVSNTWTEHLDAGFPRRSADMEQ